MTLKECKKILNIEHVELGNMPYEERIKVINKAYRTAVHKVHPDINKSPDADAQTARVNNAYSSQSKIY
jgi:hypothetical protein